ncbi:hypothetical protein [Novilysobacter spongiicola]|uniref:Polymer-forming protein n=1 Tax=Lysobacter spongiicola DSM 21749 TaxID=1122188 RepID=A0A1T4RMG2_9GAMM|nr:hypothetical protein [Lysobacter spongiicola]SKA16861.1 hypothetical protein SAMN02745674_02268 [Lysobacter spongiicola DSM 21749]
MTRHRNALSTLALAIALAAIPPAFAAQDDISKVNGAIRVDDAGRAGDLDTVNGSIKVGTGAQSGDAETVNGSITVADDAVVGGLSTVNGGIKVGTNVRMGDDVGTVNGSVFIDRGGRIDGGVETVNGAIGLVATEVTGDIETVNGDLTVGINSHVRGGIRYSKPNVSFISFSRKREPRVVIGPDARVDGPLMFERDVKLYVHETATIGAVTGAEAVSYSGSRAPTGD